MSDVPPGQPQQPVPQQPVPQQPVPPQPVPPQPMHVPPSGASGPRAGFWRRFGAAIIDGILLGIVTSIIGAIFGDTAFKFEDGTLSFGASGIAALLDLAVGIAYAVYLEGSPSGQTVGKKVLGIRVVDAQTGQQIGYGRAFLRYIGKIVSAIPCALGYLWMLWDKEKQTWHDKIATTLVVPTDAYPVDKWPG